MNISLSPQSLVMTPLCCFYCGAHNVFHTEIDYRFGLKHCGAHGADARRDCNAYKHQQGMVDVLDAKEMPAMQPLFAHATFTVQRSNGALEDGWALRHGSHYEKVFIYRVEGVWSAPLYKAELIKHVAIQEILAPEEAAQVIAALDAGVYAADGAAAAACIPGLAVLDPSFIKPAVCDGVVCRVFSA